LSSPAFAVNVQSSGARVEVTYIGSGNLPSAQRIVPQQPENCIVALSLGRTPDEVEASQLVGFPVNNPETAILAGKQLQERGVRNVIVKLGDRGVVAVTADETFFVPAFEVEAVDTVAAGDAFNGGLAAALDAGLSLSEAVEWGMAAGALCATKMGAQVAMPDRTTFDLFLQRSRSRK
jgi:sugar/nucleoside kinase (ribokinase family)